MTDTTQHAPYDPRGYASYERPDANRSQTPYVPPIYAGYEDVDYHRPTAPVYPAPTRSSGFERRDGSAVRPALPYPPPPQLENHACYGASGVERRDKATIQPVLPQTQQQQSASGFERRDTTIIAPVLPHTGPSFHAVELEDTSHRITAALANKPAMRLVITQVTTFPIGAVYVESVTNVEHASLGDKVAFEVTPDGRILTGQFMPAEKVDAFALDAGLAGSAAGESTPSLTKSGSSAASSGPVSPQPSLGRTVLAERVRVEEMQSRRENGRGVSLAGSGQEALSDGGRDEGEMRHVHVSTSRCSGFEKFDESVPSRPVLPHGAGQPATQSKPARPIETSRGFGEEKEKPSFLKKVFNRRSKLVEPQRDSAG